ncbi:MAG: CHAP domain-containing protein [Spirochaetia bacterium]|nr:CHAP domain-containing protein [Spirochaetia bacterium]
MKNLFDAFRLRSWKNADRAPKSGDLVFFNNTFDRNLNRKWDDPLTHVGLVESVDSNGTITFVHHVSGRVVRAHLNLKKPDLYAEGGKVINDFLRKRPASDHNKGRYLTSRLFAGFAETPVK